MKVIVATTTWPRWDKDDQPLFVVDQIRSLKALVPDDEFIVLAPHHEGAAREEVIDGVKVVRFRYFFPERLAQLVYPATLPNLKKRPALFIQLPFLLGAEFLSTLRLIQKEKPDVVYSHWFIPQAITAGLAALLTKTPHVFTSHSSDVALMKKIPVIGPMVVRGLLTRFSASTVVSRRTLAKMRQFFDDTAWSKVEDRVRIIPMGVYPHVQEDRDPAAERAMLGLPDDGRVVAFLGRLAGKKGVSYLLDAFATALETHPDLVLAIGGDGPLMDDLKAQTATLGLADRVHFLGYVHAEVKEALYEVADLLVLPSIITDGGDAEGLPVVLLEGLACGRIAIATDVSGADDILEDGRNGFLIGERDVEQICDAMTRAFSLTDDEREKMRDEARATAAAFSWQTIAEQTRAFLFEPLDRSA